jgi:hypothetical protein
LPVAAGHLRWKYFQAGFAGSSISPGADLVQAPNYCFFMLTVDDTGPLGKFLGVRGENDFPYIDAAVAILPKAVRAWLSPPQLRRLARLPA